MRFHMARFQCCGYGASHPPMARFSVPYRTLAIRCVIVLAVSVGLASHCRAQDDVNVHIQPRPEAPKQPEAPKPANLTDDPGLKLNHGKPLQVDVDLVLVNVTVTDDWNRIVTGLDKDNFTVMEGNEVQKVKHSSTEDAPISLGVIFDMTGSMSDKIEQARAAVIEFFKTANPQHEFFMITFND